MKSTKKVRWGVLSTAKIGLTKVLPAMQLGEYTCVAAIASRDHARAIEAAKILGIETAYGSYEELLADPTIEAIYNPLPNHMHVPWTMKAAEAGKHVLCEKPLSLTVAEARTLIEVQSRTGVIIGEAFMVRTHPQWLRAHALINAGRIGSIRAIQGFFSYTNVNPANIRNIPEYGGGALMDIGCYTIHIARYLFGEEPTRVFGCIERDPQMGIDRLTSALMDFPSGQATFTCSTQLVPYQRVHIFGTTGRIEIEIPFNAPSDRPTRIFIDGTPDAPPDLFGGGVTTETFPICDQYTLQGDAFSQAIRAGGSAPVPLADAIKNMAVIEAIFRSGVSGRAETPTA
jgi:predicted dehydrogenase